MFVINVYGLRNIKSQEMEIFSFLTSALNVFDAMLNTLLLFHFSTDTQTVNAFSIEPHTFLFISVLGFSGAPSKPSSLDVYILAIVSWRILNKQTDLK